MQSRLAPQYAHRRGPRLAIPLDADVSSVRYYRCPPAKQTTQPTKPRPNHKTHLTFVPPSMRRPTPLSDMLATWLSSCDLKKVDDSSSSSSSSSSSGACSGESATTDFSSVSCAKKYADSGFDYSSHSIIYYPQQPLQQQPYSKQYPFLVPVGTPHQSQLTPVQWAQLRQLQQASRRPMQQPPPAKLRNVHTAYFLQLDATVLEMMHQVRPQRRFVPGQPWQQHTKFYSDDVPQPDSNTKTNSSSCISNDSGAHGTEEMDRCQVCAYCYQFAVREANSKGTMMPRLLEKGHWRSHCMKDGDVIVCPRLLHRVCSLCGATGQLAHPTNFCPVTKRKTSFY